MIKTMDGAALGLKPTLLVRDEKVSLGSTESRNWPLGDSNLKSMVGLCKRCARCDQGRCRPGGLQSSKFWPILGIGDSVIALEAKKGPTEGDGLAWNCSL